MEHKRAKPPRAFSRPSIEVGGSGQPRAWKWLPAHMGGVGDTWAGHGVVRRVEADGPLKQLQIWTSARPEPYAPAWDEKLYLFTQEEEPGCAEHNYVYCVICENKETPK